MSVQNARPITDRNEKEKKFTDLANKHDLDKRYAKNCRNSFLIVYFWGYRQGDSQALANFNGWIHLSLAMKDEAFSFLE